WRDNNEDYGSKDNETLNNNIAVIIRQISNSFKRIAKEIRDA
ncbi:15036_t:CDS:1, partial [Funneliformis caledonium]